MFAFRCRRCGCLHGWADQPGVVPVREVNRQPIVAGSLPVGTTGVNVTWRCPGCGAGHVNSYGEGPVNEPTTEEIRLRAYFLWQAAGDPICDGARFWLAAERALGREPTFEMVAVAGVTRCGRSNNE